MSILLFILSILKVIGIIIGIILALILIILMVIMFSPIRYRIEVERYENISGTGEVKWLFGIIKAVVYITSDFDVKYIVRIFHKKISNAEEIENNSKPIETMEKKTEYKENNVKIKKNSETKKVDENKTTSKVENNNTENKETKKTVIKEEIKASNNIRRVNVSDIESKTIENNQKQYNENYSKKEYEKDEKDEKEDSIIKKINAIENKKEILKATILFIKRIFKGILPKNIYANMEIGAGEPSLTGYIMGIYGVGKSKYGDSINIKPYFEGFKIEGIFKAKGRIIIGKLLFDTARFVLTKPVFRLIKNILKGNVI